MFPHRFFPHSHFDSRYWPPVFYKKFAGSNNDKGSGPGSRGRGLSDTASKSKSKSISGYDSELEDLVLFLYNIY